MKKIFIYGILIASLSSMSCKNNPVIPDETQVVLRAYLYAKEPVNDIQLTQSTTVGSADSVVTPISTASVILTKNGTSYALSANSSQPGYYFYSGSNLTVASGDNFSIEVNANGQKITAATVVPTRPGIISLSNDTLHFRIDSAQTRAGTYRTRLTGLDTAMIAWNNPNNEYYYIVIESTDSTRQLLRENSAFTRRFISQPTNESSYRISPNSIIYTGTHTLKVYHINKEYADLYRSRQQDSRTLNEPLTNVKNGLGVFSAFASDSVAFSVVMDK